MRKLIALFLCLFFAFIQLNAQNKTVTGKVTDAEGKPVSGASVQVKGTKIGVSANDAGIFTISVPVSSNTLTISGVGLVSQDVKIDNKTVLNITLATSNKSLDEVIVTGYQTVRKKDVAAAISKISAAEIDNLPMPNFAQAMQGRAAGVAVSAANGVPGGSMNVIIRGVGSINAGSTPLYVVDGVQLNTGTGSINTQNNPLNFLNPNDMSLLKF